MPKIHYEKIIHAERNKVFDIATNYEGLEKKLPKYFTSIQIRSSRDNVSVIEEQLNLAGKELSMMTKHVTKYPQKHEIFVIGGDAKGSRIVEQYDLVPNGTKITIDADIKLRGALKIVGFFRKGKIKKGFVKIMDEFIKVAES